MDVEPISRLYLWLSDFYSNQFITRVHLIYWLVSIIIIQHLQQQQQHLFVVYRSWCDRLGPSLLSEDTAQLVIQHIVLLVFIVVPFVLLNGIIRHAVNAKSATWNSTEKFSGFQCDLIHSIQSASSTRIWLSIYPVFVLFYITLFMQIHIVFGNFNQKSSTLYLVNHLIETAAIWK